MGNSCYFIERRPEVFTCILINTLFCNIVYKSVNIAFDITHCRANKFVHRYSWRRQYFSCIAERSLGKSYSSFMNEFWYRSQPSYFTYSLYLSPSLFSSLPHSPHPLFVLSLWYGTLVICNPVCPLSSLFLTTWNWFYDSVSRHSVQNVLKVLR